MPYQAVLFDAGGTLWEPPGDEPAAIFGVLHFLEKPTEMDALRRAFDHVQESWFIPKIVELATLVVMQRPGWELPELESWQKSLALETDFPLRLQLIQAPLIDIASRDVRARIGQGGSVRYMIPRAVEAYIADKGLYR